MSRLLLKPWAPARIPSKLSAVEHEVVHSFDQGSTFKAIAVQYCVTPATVAHFLATRHERLSAQAAQSGNPAPAPLRDTRLRSKYLRHADTIRGLRAAGHGYHAIAKELRRRGVDANWGGIRVFLRTQGRPCPVPTEALPAGTVKALPPSPLTPYLQAIRDWRDRGFTYTQIGTLLSNEPCLAGVALEHHRIRTFLVTRDSEDGRFPQVKEDLKPRKSGYVPRRPRSRLTPHTEAILQARSEGVSLKAIGKQYGVTAGAVVQFLAHRARREEYLAKWGSGGGNAPPSP